MPAALCRHKKRAIYLSSHNLLILVLIYCVLNMHATTKPFILPSLPHGSRKLQGVKINKIFCITFSNSWDSPMEYVKNAVSKPCH